METRGEACELQQLVSSDADGENDESVVHNDYSITEEKVVSPLRSNIVSSSGNTSHSSVARSLGRGSAGVTTNSKLVYVNEKRSNRDLKNSTARPRNTHKDGYNSKIRHHCFLSEVPDVRHMERALLGLLADFHSGKLRAFGSGCTMEQMTNIREQQEKLAKLHFDLVGTSDPPLSDDGLKHSHNTMSQLVQRLEQLSVSIEGLHNSTDK